MVDDSVDLCVVFTVLNNCPEVKVKVTFRWFVILGLMRVRDIPLR